MSSLNVLWRMLAVDLRFGAREVAGRFGAALALLVFLTVLFVFVMVQEDGSFAQLSFIDYFTGLFGGIREFDPKHDNNFNVPASWLCVCLMGGFIVLSYPTQNLESIGIKQCIEARGRWCWWISKCLWTTACTFLYWLLAVAVALLASFINGYSGFDNLKALASIRNVVDDDTIRSWIERVGLDPASKRRYRAYSLGMKQRLGIAAALMESPAFVMLDEPTNALDADGVQMVRREVEAARDRGAAVVLACHDASVLRGLSDEIWYLAEGHIDRHEVLTGPVDPQEACHRK